MLALVTALYGALIALLMVVTAFGVVKVRRAESIVLGSGGSAVLEQKMRVHANLTEYAPISLLLLLFLELNQAETLWDSRLAMGCTIRKDAIGLVSFKELLGRYEPMRKLNWNTTTDRAK